MKKLNITKPDLFLQKFAVVVILVFAALCHECFAQEFKGVLVASESSQVKEISILEIRRIYLGLPSASESNIKAPVINLSNQDVYKAFLKNIMHMTEKGYKRKIVKRIFRQGGKKVKEIDDVDELVKYLEENTNHVSFMDEETAKKFKGIKVVQVLW